MNLMEKRQFVREVQRKYDSWGVEPTSDGTIGTYLYMRRVVFDAGGEPYLANDLPEAQGLRENILDRLQAIDENQTRFESLRNSVMDLQATAKIFAETLREEFYAGVPDSELPSEIIRLRQMAERLNEYVQPNQQDFSCPDAYLPIRNEVCLPTKLGTDFAALRIELGK